MTASSTTLTRPTPHDPAATTPRAAEQLNVDSISGAALSQIQKHQTQQSLVPHHHQHHHEQSLSHRGSEEIQEPTVDLLHSAANSRSVDHAAHQPFTAQASSSSFSSSPAAASTAGAISSVMKSELLLSFNVEGTADDVVTLLAECAKACGWILRS
eukprot:Selendium_serpulae@DN3727_c0_g1_i2.p1